MVSPQPGQAALDLDQLARDLHQLLARYPEVAACWLFGSALRGPLRFDSDVDLGVLFRAGAADHERILGEIAARAEAVTSPYPVDLVDMAAQGVVFAHEVLCSGRRVYEADRDRRVDFESHTCVRAFDFRPTHDLAVRGQREGILRQLGRRSQR